MLGETLFHSRSQCCLVLALDDGETVVCAESRVAVFFDAVDAVLPGAAGAGSFTIDQGSVVVADLPVVTFVCVLLAAILPAIANLVVIVCAFRFFRRLLLGDAFAPGNARLLSIASIAILCGWIADTWFGTMASNGALAAATEELATFGVGLDWYTTRERTEHEILPWDHLDSGLDKEWLWDDWQDALSEEEVADCRWTPCYDCGVCPTMGTEIQIGPTGRSLLPLTVV